MALRTPPRGLLLSRFPAGAVRGLADVAPADLPGRRDRPTRSPSSPPRTRNGPGDGPRLNRHDRLYELTEPVSRRDRPAGRAWPRPATRSLLDLCGPSSGRDRHRGRSATSSGRGGSSPQGRVWLWEVDGTPVCLVGHSPTVAGVTRIGPVWTPPEHRRQGYAAAATATVATRLAERGRVVLFADLGNPTSTGVYLRIGFRPVGAWDEWRLEY